MFEGTVEVCYYNTWGLISDADWSDKEALILCKQLFYNVSGIFASKMGLSLFLL